MLPFVCVTKINQSFWSVGMHAQKAQQVHFYLLLSDTSTFPLDMNFNNTHRILLGVKSFWKNPKEF